MIQFWLSIGLAAQTAMALQPFPVQFMRNSLGRSVTVCIDGRKVETTFAGKLTFRDANHAWVSVCADVRSPIVARQSYYVRAVNTSVAGGNYAMAGNIVAKYFNQARTADQCAGLQLAVWEAIEDGGRQADFSTGHFQARATPAAIAFAETYYAAVEEPGGATYLQTGGGGGQSQISTSL